MIIRIFALLFVARTCMAGSVVLTLVRVYLVVQERFGETCVTVSAIQAVKRVSNGPESVMHVLITLSVVRIATTLVAPRALKASVSKVLGIVPLGARGISLGICVNSTALKTVNKVELKRHVMPMGSVHLAASIATRAITAQKDRWTWVPPRTLHLQFYREFWAFCLFSQLPVVTYGTDGCLNQQNKTREYS